ncbi:hypothetical protein Lmor_2045 [Legionella moravica]|uniref:Uncharacterized protein n=1 Tax=Legionella moravica TaxID=39962 RepID=A0A378JVF0_9GAMM|nr:IQ calmodulin-binding motif-containing protein [Legionella moravica]KTD32616.1 hypothetical protein Lmor_2045 [Legionella moravica]STX61442.1 Uncharacterised protein [Legionella moravica]
MGVSKTDGTQLKNEAAVTIQSAYRGFFSRKSFAISQLPPNCLKPFKVLIKGNDPEITGLPHHSREEHIALVAISGMRSVEIACQLSSGTPKLIIIDNSQYVVDFWRMARFLINKSDSTDDFLVQLARFLESSQCSKSGLQSREFAYLGQLFNQYGFEKLQSIIGKTSVLAQSWVDRDVMIKVKNILKFIGIDVVYAYPSNVVAYLRSEGQRSNSNQVLDNIQSLNPALAIHTDLVMDRPEHVYITADHTPQTVADKLNLNAVRFSSSVGSFGKTETLLMLYLYNKLKKKSATSLAASGCSLFSPDMIDTEESSSDASSSTCGLSTSHKGAFEL